MRIILSISPPVLFDCNVEQAPEVGEPFERIGSRRRDPPAKRCRINEENVARHELRLFTHAELLRVLRLAHQALDAGDEPLADAVERRCLLAAGIEGELLKKNARKRGLRSKP